MDTINTRPGLARPIPVHQDSKRPKGGAKTQEKHSASESGICCVGWVLTLDTWRSGLQATIERYATYVADRKANFNFDGMADTYQRPLEEKLPGDWLTKA